MDAFRMARRAFLASEQIDMGALASSAGVDRATLFRWLGNRDQLLEEIIWSFAGPAWERSVEGASGRGAERVVGALTAWVSAITAEDAAFFHAYLRREPVRALRLLTTRDGLHQQRVIDVIQALLVEEETAGLELPMDSRDFAYVITRLAESFIYSDLITGESPDAAKASAAIAALLGLPTGSRQATRPSTTKGSK